MSLFPQDDKARKMLPVFKMLTGYFPKAMREITKVCVVNNVRYNPDKAPADINWARGKSPDQIGSAFRHIFEREVDGLVFETVPLEVAETTGFKTVYVLAEAAWRLCAALELEIEKMEGIQTIPTAVEAPGAAIGTPAATAGQLDCPPGWEPCPGGFKSTNGPSLILKLESEDPDTIGELEHGDRTDQEGRDAQGSRQEAGSAHHSV
jgi:hypothetical protein